LKYADALFEIILVGGILQPGGTYAQDGAPSAPFSIIKAQDTPKVDEMITEMKKYVEVLNKLIRRYKYLQKPLEESSLPASIQYVDRWPPAHRDKFAIATGLLMSQGLANASALQNLAKDHLVKNDLALHIVTKIFQAYLTDQSMDHLGTALRKGGIKDLLIFLPSNKRDTKTLETYFKNAGLPQVAEWFIKKQTAAVKEDITKNLKEIFEDEHKSNDDIIEYLKGSQESQPIPESDLVSCIWTVVMSLIDWNARSDQIEGQVLREVGNRAPILEPFCTSAKTQVALINAVQVYCYDETRVMKTFPQLLKVLYNQDCLSDKAIVYWHQKGHKAQGKQHFLKSTEALVKFLEEQESEEEDE